MLGLRRSHLEPLKLTRYGPGDHFSYHHDADRYGGYLGGSYNCYTANCNRVATIVMYLNECDGGETVFRNLRLNGNEPLAVPPRKGAALIHFPANSADATVPARERGRYDPRVGHEGAPVGSNCEKFICQQWAWTGPLDRYRAPLGYQEDRWPWREDPGATPL